MAVYNINDVHLVASAIKSALNLKARCFAFCRYVQGDDSVISCVFNDQTGKVDIKASTNVDHSHVYLSNVSQLSQLLSSECSLFYVRSMKS